MWFTRLARFQSLAPDWNWTCPRVSHGEPVNTVQIILEDVRNIATEVGVTQLSKHRLTLCHLYPTSPAAAAISNVCRSFMILNYEFHLHLLNHWCIQTYRTSRRILRCRHRSTKICNRGSHSLKHDADGMYDVGCEQRASVRWECQRHRRYKKFSRIRWICCCRHLNQRVYRIRKSRLCF